MSHRLPLVALYPLVGLCSTLWLHLGAPIVPLGALLALAAADVRRLGRRRFIPIAVGALLGFAGQGLFVGAPSWSPDGLSAGVRFAVEAPETSPSDVVALVPAFEVGALPPEANRALNEGEVTGSQPRDAALRIDATDWWVPSSSETHQQRVVHPDGSHSVIWQQAGSHPVIAIVRVHADAERAQAVHGWLEAALTFDVMWTTSEGGPSSIVGFEMTFDEAARTTLGDAVLNVVGAADEGRPSSYAALYRRGRVVIITAAARVDGGSAATIAERMRPALERVADAAVSAPTG